MLYFLLQEVPCAAGDIQEAALKDDSKSTKKEDPDELKIAWRYQNQPKIQVY